MHAYRVLIVNRCLTFLLVASLPLMAVSQEIPPEILKKMEEVPAKNLTHIATQSVNYLEVKKGFIHFSDGSSTPFRKLKLLNDSVTFRDSTAAYFKYALADIRQITKYQAKIMEGTGYGLATGIVLGISAGALIYPENSFIETLIQIFSNNEDEPGPKLSKKAVPVIIGTSLAGAVIGALVGTSYHKSKIVYPVLKPVVFTPQLLAFPDRNNALMLTFSITFR